MNSNTPQLRFDGFSGDWEQRKLKDISKYRNGKAHEQVEDVDGKFIIINSKFISTDSKVQRHTNEQVEPMLAGEIAMVLSDLPKGKALAKVFLVDENDKYTLNQRIGAITPEENIDSTFLKHRLNRNNYFLRFDSGVTQTNLSKSEVENFVSLYPSIEEQRKISFFLKNIEDTITLQERKLKLLKEQKKGFLQKMFPKEGSQFPELRFSGFTDAWEQIKLKDLGDTFTGLSGKTRGDFGHGQAKFVTYVNVYTHTISDLLMTENVEIDEKQNQVKYGDIFFTTSSETPEEVGMSSVWLGNENNVYLNSFCFGYRPTAELEPYYAAFMLRSSEVRKKFMLLAQGISRYNISKTKAMEMFVPFPIFEEQQKIGAFFKQLDDSIALQERKLDALKEQKKGILQKMFV